MTRRGSNRAPGTRAPRPHAHDPYLSILNDDHRERKTLRRSVAVAAGLHVALLLTAIPQTTSGEPEPPPERKIFVIQPIKYKPPVVDKKTPPKRRAKKVFIPDPDPDAPEPIRVDEPNPVLELQVDDDFGFAIPDAPPEPEPEGPVRVGGKVKPPTRIRYVEPRYTEIARQARTQGTVILELWIDPHGDVAEIKVLRGLPFGLTEEATRAVEQWKFEPSTLNGKPVAVIYVLTVQFGLR